MGGRVHVSGRGWQQPYGLDYKEGIDSISKRIRNDGCQVSPISKRNYKEGKGESRRSPVGCD